MIIALGMWAPDRWVPRRAAAQLRYGTAWVSGAARTADARRSVQAFLARAAASAGTRFSARAEQDALLIASELVGNALRHAPGPCGLVLELYAADQAEAAGHAQDAGRVGVTGGDDREAPDDSQRSVLGIGVWDTSPALPLVHERDGARVGGHGLYLVRACSRALGAALRPVGKEIIAEVAL
ncbi:ATP-binding protein [Streptomyces sp. NPDC046985]|uniref:ATP-binding protein n=1 Tax=Streptomyces sp. NPDC046985 TaxID=3155377 RepID=UPI0033E59176